MTHSLIRRIFVLLVAALVTAGMGLPVVQANSMPMQMMDMGNAMADGMLMPMAAKCPDCDKSDQTTGMPSCVAPACTVQSAVSPIGEALRVVQFGMLRLRPLRSRLLVGHNSVPDPYPPRISDIV